MTQVVESILDGSPMRAEKELGWNRVTLAKALKGLKGELAKLTQKQMELLEQRFQRLEDLEKWFVHITPLANIQNV